MSHGAIGIPDFVNYRMLRDALLERKTRWVAIDPEVQLYPFTPIKLVHGCGCQCRHCIDERDELLQEIGNKAEAERQLALTYGCSQKTARMNYRKDCLKENDCISDPPPFEVPNSLSDSAIEGETKPRPARQQKRAPQPVQASPPLTLRVAPKQP